MVFFCVSSQANQANFAVQVVNKSERRLVNEPRRAFFLCSDWFV